MKETIQFHERYKLKAKACTHIHIGCGKDVGRFEYFFSQNKSQLEFLDYDKLAIEALNNEVFIDQLTLAAAGDPSGSLHKLLLDFAEKDPGIYERIISKKATRKLPSPDGRQGLAFPNIRRLRLFAGSPAAYLPGSSLKGAFRSAYLSKQIDGLKNKDDIFPRLKDGDDQSNLRLLRERLQKTFRPGADDTRFFEKLIVRDGKTFQSSDMGIACIGLYGSQKKQSNKKAAEVSGRDSDEYAEVLLAGSEFEIEISLRRLAGSRPDKFISSLKELLEISDAFYRKVWQAEKKNQQILFEQKKAVMDSYDFYHKEENQVPDDSYLIRVGYGAGQASHSVLLSYRETFQEIYGQSADHPLRHSAIYSRKKPQLKTREPYPFTSRSALAGTRSDWIPLGWIALSKAVLNVD
ncbi:MAG: type III-A CRISPR-associated RAMP protein Csm5 [Candidatus Obscuribacterales bacterium]|nr:type III-A CRISPR-associated RAMP protein Csm5 [Candidatus Obscuribacterales bacterium]